MCYENVVEWEVSLQRKSEVAAVRAFLAPFGLNISAETEYIIALFCQERMIASGSLAGDCLCNIAVDSAFRERGLAVKVVSNLIQEAGRRGRYRYFVNVGREAEPLFTAMGFSEVARTDPDRYLLAMGLDAGPGFRRKNPCS